MKNAQSFSSFNNQFYDSTKKYGYSSLRQKIMASLVDKNQKVLDLGCGTGSFIKLLNQKNKEVEGLEISQKAAQIGQKKGLKIKIADLHQTFPYSKNTFDTITAGEIIEHIYDTDFFLEEIKRILKPNGFLILSTPNIATLGRRLMLLFGINPLIDTSLDQSSGHIRYFTKKSLADLLQKHNFQIQNFTSDSINFSNNGKFQIRILAKFFPTLGARLIIKAINLK
jgi:2-polyprenyl-3-methyl-5-hydroxy-6-metoxy-1,4-benzoquinol methylase